MPRIGNPTNHPKPGCATREDLFSVALIATSMIAAIPLAHTSDVLTLSNTGGWALELQGLYLATALIVALQGAGRYSVAGTRGRWN